MRDGRRRRRGDATRLQHAQGDLASSATPGRQPRRRAGDHDLTGCDGRAASGSSATRPDGNLSGARRRRNCTAVAAYNADGAADLGLRGRRRRPYRSPPAATSCGYDAGGNQTRWTRAATTTTSYNADDHATLVTDPDNNATLTHNYDGDGNYAQTVPPVGVVAANLTPASCPASYPAGYGSRLASDATTHTFDGDGNQTAMTTCARAERAQTTAFSPTAATVTC